MRSGGFRLVGLLTVGGGFGGLVSTVSASTQAASLWETLFLLFVAAIFGAGAWAGVRMLQAERSALRWGLLFWALQVPYVMTPLIGFSLVSAGMALFIWPVHGDFDILFRLGSAFTASVLKPTAPTAIGFNLVAVVITIYLYGEKEGIQWKRPLTS